MKPIILLDSTAFSTRCSGRGRELPRSVDTGCGRLAEACEGQKKRVWTLPTHAGSDWFVVATVCAGFRIFSERQNPDCVDHPTAAKSAG